MPRNEVPDPTERQQLNLCGRGSKRLTYPGALGRIKTYRCLNPHCPGRNAVDKGERKVGEGHAAITLALPDQFASARHVWERSWTAGWF